MRKFYYQPSVEKMIAAFDYNPETGEIIKRSNQQVCIGMSNGYIQVSFEGVHIPGHRLAWCLFHGEWPSVNIDHKNRDRKDNRIENLRLCNQSQNSANRTSFKKNSSGHPGVYFDGFSYRAHIWHRGNWIYLGRHDTLEKAATAYKEKRKQLFGEFAS